MDKRELKFFANDIATDDAFYIHFSDIKRNPENYIIFQGRRGSPTSVSVRAWKKDAQCTNGITDLSLDRDHITAHLSQDLIQSMGGLTVIVVEFREEDEKFKAIRRQLYEILGYCGA